MRIEIELSETEIKILEHDLLDVEQWVRQAVQGKINSCKKRMISPYKSPLVDLSDDEIVDQILQDPKYKNRVKRDEIIVTEALD